MRKPDIDTIVQHIGNTMPTFGGGRGGDGFNPVAEWTKDKPLMFAMGVDVRAVVEFVLSESAALAHTNKKQTKEGNA